MSLAAFVQALTVWLWLNILGASLVLFESGPQQRFWILLTTAGLSYVSLRLLMRFVRDRS